MLSKVQGFPIIEVPATGYSVAEHEYTEYQRLKAMSRRAWHVRELPDATAAAISKARMNPAHDALNALLEP